MKVDISHCGRCTGKHDQLDFAELKRAAGEYNWWAMCPVTQEPLLLRRTINFPPPVTLVLPFPPLANHLKAYRAVLPKGTPKHVREKTFVQVYDSTKAKSWKEAAGLMVKDWGQRERLQKWRPPGEKDELEVDITAYRPARRGDVDGPIKATLDFLQGITYEDDDCISDLGVHRRLDRENPRVEVKVGYSYVEPDFLVTKEAKP